MRAGERARLLRALHHRPGRPLVLPNAWDAVSARAFAGAGFPAVATSSVAVAAVLGYPDGEQAPGAEMIAAAGRIARAVDVPVTADLEGGYGIAPAEFAARLAELGVAGCNIEDTDHGSGGLVDAEKQAARLAELRAAAGDGLVVNARVDAFLRIRDPEAALAEALRRARAYLDAGADCVYPILAPPELLPRLVAGIPGPVNAHCLVGRDDYGLPELIAAGVARVTYGGALWRDTLPGLEALAAAIAPYAPAP